jgi:hypothetical protein
MLSHGQDGVPGRRWTTEVGIRQVAEDAELACSVLLKTDEISARVTAPVQATRPGIVQSLIDNFNPTGNTPRLSIKRLTPENAAAFAYDVEHVSRRHTVVQISCNHDGGYPVMPERMRSLLVGLAQVIDIDVNTDTYELQRILGRRCLTFGGAINIIFPVRKTEGGQFCKTVLLRPDDIKEIEEGGGTIESEVLGVVTHHTNLPHSWRHVSNEIVGQAILRSRLQRAAVTAGTSEELAAYETMLLEAEDQLGKKDIEIADLRDDAEAIKANLDQARAENEGLKHALSGSRSRSDVESESITNALSPLREALRSVLADRPPLERALHLVAGLYPDRIVALDTAFEAAKDADRRSFRHGKKAFELLMTLAEEYWVALAKGEGDQHAKSAFGNAFAAREASSLSNEGKRRRTFNYLGREITMEKHLKFGVKDSLSETLRIHFEWFPREKKIVIGHCGKHLDF